MAQTFRRVEDALRFAFRYSGEVYERPLMNRLADDPVRIASDSLVGLDGAGQAAMIFAQVLRLSAMSQFVLYAAFAPHASPCHCGSPCCMGHRPNPFWEACIVKIEEAAMTRALAGCVTNRVLRRGIVRRIFGDTRHSLKALAKHCEVAEKTASTHAQRIKGWIDGTREDDWSTGIRPRALAQVDEFLRYAGIVSSEA